MRVVQLLVVVSSLPGGAIALKGTDFGRRSLRALAGPADAVPKGPSDSPAAQKGPTAVGSADPKGAPVAKADPNGAPVAKADPKAASPKAGPDALPKDPKSAQKRKCKMVKTTKSPPARRKMIDAEPYCLQDQGLTAEECSEAKTGKVPESHASVTRDVGMNIAYHAKTNRKEILHQVEEIFRSKTAAAFIGCDDISTRRLQPLDDNAALNDPAATAAAELTVAGVNFQNVMISKGGAFIWICRFA